MKRARSPGVVVAGAAAGGVILGHVLAYLLAEPDAGRRLAHLAGTGHGGFGLLAWSGAIAAVLALAWTMVGAALGPRVRGPSFPVLAVAQVLAFAAIELVERDLSVTAAASDRAVLIGLVLQLLVAAALVAALGAAVRTADRLARGREGIEAPRAVPWRVPAGPNLRPAGHLLLGRRRRAPPLPSPA